MCGTKINEHMYFVIHSKCGILHHIHETSIVSWSKTSSRLRPTAYFPFSFRLWPPFLLQLYQQSFSLSLYFSVGRSRPTLCNQNQWSVLPHLTAIFIITVQVQTFLPWYPPHIPHCLQYLHCYTASQQVRVLQSQCPLRVPKLDALGPYQLSYSMTRQIKSFTNYHFLILTSLSFLDSLFCLYFSPHYLSQSQRRAIHVLIYPTANLRTASTQVISHGPIRLKLKS